MKTTEAVVKSWEESGLLRGIENEEHRTILAQNLEKASADLVIRYSDRYEGTCVTALFPVIRRIMIRWGFQSINVRELYADLHESWEMFIRRPDAAMIDERGDLEAEFCTWFTEEKGREYVEGFSNFRMMREN